MHFGQRGAVCILDSLFNGERPLQPDIVGGDNHRLGVIFGDGEGIPGDAVAVRVLIKGKAGCRGKFLEVVAARLQADGDFALAVGDVPPADLHPVRREQVEHRAGDGDLVFGSVGQFLEL